MTKKLITMSDLYEICMKRWSALDSISPEYLSESGAAAKEAYRAVIWHCAFHDTLESLRDDENFIELSNIPNKHPEYYKVLRVINKALSI